MKATVDQLVWRSTELRCQLLRNETAQLGHLLDRAWELKKRMASSVHQWQSFPLPYDYYRKAREPALRAASLGAGAGGCLLCACRLSSGTSTSCNLAELV